MNDHNDEHSIIGNNVMIKARNARSRYEWDTLTVFVKKRRHEPIIYVQSNAAIYTFTADEAWALTEQLSEAVERADEVSGASCDGEGRA